MIEMSRFPGVGFRGQDMTFVVVFCDLKQTLDFSRFFLQKSS